LAFKSEILQMYLIFLYAVQSRPWIYFHRPSPPQPIDNRGMHITVLQHLCNLQRFKIIG